MFRSRERERVVFLHASCQALDNVNDAQGGIFLFKGKGCILILHSTTLKNTPTGRTRCLQSGGGLVLSAKKRAAQTVTSSEN